MNSWDSAVNRFLLTLYCRVHDAGVHQFQDLVLDGLKAVAPFDAAFWGTATMRPKGLDIHSFHLHRTTVEMLKAYEEVKHLDAIPAELVKHERTTMAFNMHTLQAGKKLLPLREFSRAFGHENMLITSHYDEHTQLLQWIALIRSDPAQVCRPSELAAVERLSPHLMQALAMNRRMHLERLLADGARKQWCSAVVDERGVVLHAEAGFLSLVGSEWPCPREHQLALPLVKKLRLSSTSVVGKNVVVESAVEGGVLFLKARKRLGIDGLSSSELLVAHLLASGLTQKQVAQKLKRSSETVRSHVRNIFKKLGISSTAMLGTALGPGEV